LTVPYFWEWHLNFLKKKIVYERETKN
jgi:hypothetical protein